MIDLDALEAQLQDGATPVLPIADMRAAVAELRSLRALVATIDRKLLDARQSRIDELRHAPTDPAPAAREYPYCNVCALFGDDAWHRQTDCPREGSRP